jgi:peroxiredoxin
MPCPSAARAAERRPRVRLGILVVAILLATVASPLAALEQGEAAPAFKAPGLSGGTVSLAEYRGKVVYLDFWASWCAPCAVALPALERLRQEFPADQFQVLAVNVDRQPELAKTFLRRRPVSYPSAFDPKGEIPVQFGVETMPTSFLIDRQGVVRHVHRGFREEDVPDLRERIHELVTSGR